MDYTALASGASVETSVVQAAAFAGVFLAIMMLVAILFGLLTLPLFFTLLWASEKSLMLIEGTGLLVIKIALLLIRGLRRNILRTSLSYFALFVLTFVLSGLYTIVNFLKFVTEEKTANFKVIMTEKYSIPSMMPPGYVERMENLLKELPPQYRPPGDDKTIADNVMSWSFVGASTDPSNPRPENAMFLFSLEPRKILTMMDGLERKDLDEKELAIMEENVRLMEEDPQAIIVSKSRLEKMNLKVGERVKLSQLGFKENLFEFNIVGMIPEGKFEGVAMMNRKYLMNQMQAYERSAGKPHPLASKAINLIWVRLPDKAAYEHLAQLVNDSKNFSGPETKLETSSALIGNIMEGFKDIVWAMKYLMTPAMVAIMALVIANAISIGVRERRTELAVFKVLGFRPWHVMALVLCEALLIGFLAGGMSVLCFKIAFPVIKVPIGIFGAFPTPNEILLIGPALGMAVAFVGSFLPARSAKNVKAVEVFTKVG
jgi:putative ABC transport system permease protein